MIKSLEDLEKILKISDKDQRMQRLKSLAAELGVLGQILGRPDGQDDEQHVVIAVYDGILAQEKDAQKNRRFVFLIIGGFIIGLVLVVFVPRTLITYLRLIRAKYEDRSVAYKGFNDDGDVIEDEKGQPVLFRDMEGDYEQYYDNGSIHFEYRYSSGKVVEQKEYDHKGRLIAHFIYDEDGNPVNVWENDS